MSLHITLAHFIAHNWGPGHLILWGDKCESEIDYYSNKPIHLSKSFPQSIRCNVSYWKVLPALELNAPIHYGGIEPGLQE